MGSSLQLSWDANLSADISESKDDGKLEDVSEDVSEIGENLDSGSLHDNDLLTWTMEEEDYTVNAQGLTAEEMLGQDFEREAANNSMYMFSPSFGLSHLVNRESHH